MLISYDSNSRLEVDEDENGKFRLDRVYLGSIIIHSYRLHKVKKQYLFTFQVSCHFLIRTAIFVST